MNRSLHKSDVQRGQFNFDDGGVYIGGCDEGKAHGLGVCTGPMGQGEFSGTWQGGFEVSGVFSWSRDGRYAGQWMQGKRHGLGVESRGHWIYAGEFTQGCMGRYGVRQSTKSEAKHEGTWTHGLQDGYGSETYADLGTYQGQWMKGCRHGYGVRKSAPYSKACFIQDHGKRRSSLTSTRSSYESSSTTPQTDTAVKSPDSHLNHDMKATKVGHFLASCKLGFSFNRASLRIKNSNDFLRERSRSAVKLVSDSVRNRLKKKEKRNDGDIATEFCFASSPSRIRLETTKKEQNRSNVFVGSDNEVIETYFGEWKHDRRDGFGVCERSDGIKYEGEWLGNRRHGYGMTYFPQNLKEMGRYKDDVLMTKNNKNKWLSGLPLAAKKREKERVLSAVASAQKAAQLANQKSDIANSRMESARSKASAAVEAQAKALKDAQEALNEAKTIKQNELEALTRAGPSQIVKRSSIPRHHLMMNKDSNKVPQYRSFSQHDIPDENQTHQVRGENGLGRSGHSPDLLIAKYNQAIRPDSLQLVKQNSPALLANYLYASNENSLDMPHTLSSTTSTIPSQISEKIDIYFSYLNDEDCPPSNARLQQRQAKYCTGSLPRKLEENRSRQKASTEEGTGFPFLMRFKRDLPVIMPNSNQPLWVNGSMHRLLRDKKSFSSNRRLTLPSIIKSFKAQSSPVVDKQKNSEFDSGISLDIPCSKTWTRNCDDTVLIIDGERKFMEVQSCANVAINGRDLNDNPLTLPSTVKIRKLPTPRRQELGSMPDFSRMHKIAGEALPWKEVEFLSKMKREELERKRKTDEEIRKTSIIIRLGDFKDWLGRNTCVIFIFAVNTVLFVLFYILLK